MPNWCQNTIEISGDLQELTDLMGAMKDRGFCEAVIPLGEWEYAKAVATWGTKWDMQVEDDAHYEMTDNGDGTGSLFVDGNSAWSPPVPVFDEISKNFTVEAWWVEPGMEFCGQHMDGEVTDWDGVSDIDDIPEDEHESMADGLRSWLVEEKEWNATQNIDWDNVEYEDAE